MATHREGEAGEVFSHFQQLALEQGGGTITHYQLFPLPRQYPADVALRQSAKENGQVIEDIIFPIGGAYLAWLAKCANTGVAVRRMLVITEPSGPSAAETAVSSVGQLLEVQRGVFQRPIDAGEQVRVTGYQAAIASLSANEIASIQAEYTALVAQNMPGVSGWDARSADGVQKALFVPDYGQDGVAYFARLFVPPFESPHENAMSAWFRSWHNLWAQANPLT